MNGYGHVMGFSPIIYVKRNEWSECFDINFYYRQ